MCLTRAALALSLSSCDGNFGGKILSYGSSRCTVDLETAVEACLRGGGTDRGAREEEVKEEEAKVLREEVDCLDIR